VSWVRFRYEFRFRDDKGVGRDEPFEGGVGGWRSALIARRDLLRAGSTRVRLVRRRRRRDDPWEDLEEAPVPPGRIKSSFGARR